jgi:hypothetical protein
MVEKRNGGEVEHSLDRMVANKIQSELSSPLGRMDRAGL